MEDIIAKKLSQKRAAGLLETPQQPIDESPIDSIANLMRAATLNKTPNNFISYDNSNVQKDEEVIREKKVVSISDYDVFTKLKNIDGKDWPSILVYLLELHLMGELGRIEQINLPEYSRSKILEKLGSFSSILSSLLSGS